LFPLSFPKFIIPENLISVSCLTFKRIFLARYVAFKVSRRNADIDQAKQHARSVAKHLGLKKGLVYLLGTPTRIGEDSDMPVAFKQRRYFYYMSGVNFEDCVLTYDIEKDDLRLYIPEPDLLSVIWLGATPSKVECEERYEVDQVKYNTGIDGYVSKWVQQNSDGIVLILHPRQVPQVLKRDEWKDLKEKGVINSTLLQPAMDAARVIKSEYEIEQIRRANDISSAAHRRVLETLVTAKNETEIHGIFEGSCICAGAKKQAYAPIVGSGENASTLHYDANNQNLAGKELVCVDAGCEWENYASDITRTFPISGSFSEEAKEIYSIVEDMQEQCISKIAPGVLYRNLHNLAMEIGIKGLMDLGILCNGAYDEILKSGSGRAFFPHGVSLKLFCA
jgi:Xaa-Pro dipeptidase